jgi:hypothetical protein
MLNPVIATAPAHAGPRPEVFDANEIRLSGIVQRVWERNGRRPPGWKSGDPEPTPDIYARLSIYDVHAEEIKPEDHSELRRDPQGQLPMRRAHYVTLRFPYGRTSDGFDVSLAPRSRVRITGFVRDVPYEESLQKILTQLRMFDRIVDGDDRKTVQRVSTYVIVRTLTRLGN